MQDARKETIGRAEAIRLARGLDRIVAMKGRKVAELDLRAGKAADARIAALVVGPTGNLRAPALRVGKTLLIGFEEGTYGGILT